MGLKVNINNHWERSKFIFLINITVILFPVFSYGAIIEVKLDGTGDFISIQEAVNESNSGDTILVYPGTYFENINYNGKAITITSLYMNTQDDYYIHNTIIDGDYNGERCITIEEISGTPILNGFTVQNGGGITFDEYGGGIYVEEANPQILNCVIQYNIAKSGGGIVILFSNTYLSNVSIRYNYSRNIGGGLICGYEASFIFDSENKCNIYLNFAANASDFYTNAYSPVQTVVVDTFTVANPDQHFIFADDLYGFPMEINFSMDHAFLTQTNADLYVDPTNGNDDNHGLDEENALRTIAFALKKIKSDSLNPKTIHLQSGRYSWSTNGEKVKLGMRSHINLVGTYRDSVIIDCDSVDYAFYVNKLTKNWKMRNISFVNGYGSFDNVGGERNRISNNSNVTLDSLRFENFFSIGQPLSIGKTDSLFCNNLIFENNFGSGVSISNNNEIERSFRIQNCIFRNNQPCGHVESGFGGGLGIGADDDYLSYTGEVINTQITENIRWTDAFFGNYEAAGMSTGGYAIIDLINCTMGDNKMVTPGYVGGGLNLRDGATVNMYNCIMYGDSLYEVILGDKYEDAPVTLNVSYSNIEGGEEGILNLYNNQTLNWLEGNMDTIPYWNDTAAFPYSLAWNSPLIDKGTPFYNNGMEPPYIKEEDGSYILFGIHGDTTHLPHRDLAGKPRIRGGRIDMGAFEWQDTVSRAKNYVLREQEKITLDAYPNPFQYNAFVHYELQQAGNIRLEVLNIKGQHIATLAEAYSVPGSFTTIWSGEDEDGFEQPPGAYLIQIKLDGINAGILKVIKK